MATSNKEIDYGNSVNYTYRMHDPRLGRFFAVDPLTPEYPELSSYQFSSNRVIDRIEFEGLESTSIPRNSRRPALFVQSSGRVVRTYIGNSYINRVTSNTIRIGGLSTSRGSSNNSTIEHGRKSNAEVLTEVVANFSNLDFFKSLQLSYEERVAKLNGSVDLVRDTYNQEGKSAGFKDKTALEFSNKEDKAAFDNEEKEYNDILKDLVQQSLTKQGYGGAKCIPCTPAGQENLKDKSNSEASQNVINKTRRTIVTFVMGPSPKEKLKSDIENSPNRVTTITKKTIDVIQ